jgi:hypothetical protein
VDRTEDILPPFWRVGKLKNRFLSLVKRGTSGNLQYYNAAAMIRTFCGETWACSTSPMKNTRELVWCGAGEVKGNAAILSLANSNVFPEDALPCGDQ